MPLSERGRIMVAHHLRESDQSFLEHFGPEKLREKLEQEGVYAYGFPDVVTRNKAVDLLFALGKECKWGDNLQLREKYTPHLNYLEVFSFEYWSSIIRGSREVLVIKKPFPKLHFDKGLNLQEIPFREVPVYRLADLTDEKIAAGVGGGLLWHIYCYIDLNRTVRRT